ncbi:MAG: hypothetical protein QMD32_06745 [Smithellaceae bacterium]|nr:hypothetical protein [Smithellaceae bacterium]
MRPISELTPAEIENAMQSYANKAQVTGTAWAKARADADYLDECRRVILAEEMSTAMQAGETSLGGQERIAYASRRYQDHLSVLREARHLAHQREIEYRACCTKCDLARSILSTRREEMKSLGGGR